MCGENERLLIDGKRDYGSSNDHLNEFHCHDDKTDVPSTNRRAKRVLWVSLTVCLAFMVCEVVGGLLAQSLAIITDAAHLLTDFASMLISLFALYLSGRPASQRMSFGWYRAEVLGAFISVFMIWIITGILVYLAIDRIVQADYDIDAPIMAITAGLGVIVNIVMGVLLYFGGHTHSHGAKTRYFHETREQTNINVRAAMIHVLGDLIQSVGVLIAALLIFFNRTWSVVDPICTLLFSLIVLCTTFYVIRDALVVLLEGRPSSIDFRNVFDSLENIEGVRKVHDLRIWALTLDRVAISVHLEVNESANAQQILKTTTLMLRNTYGVHESTIQIEGYLPSTQDCNHCVPPT
ncbi:Zinc transporter 2 [Toxocara canis]|uniref:Zinc transporter 2 n=1 Tax=Toxocara canis TaxID=6265 RepID=A0A0B2UPT7_TOXCA|nr:Zinc transporter 2 [Toxocara canis]